MYTDIKADMHTHTNTNTHAHAHTHAREYTILYPRSPICATPNGKKLRRFISKDNAKSMLYSIVRRSLDSRIGLSIFSGAIAPVDAL